MRENIYEYIDLLLYIHKFLVFNFIKTTTFQYFMNYIYNFMRLQCCKNKNEYQNKTLFVSFNFYGGRCEVW